MAQKMMWSQFELQYRGQASEGQVVTVVEEAMHLALRRAGNQVFESDWWVETPARVLEHWGVYCKRWTDPATNVPRLHFTLGEPKPGIEGTGPLTTRIMTGPLDKKRK